MNAYFTSPVNLGLFITEADQPISDEETEEVEFTREEIELSPLGLSLAQSYDAVVAGLPVVRDLATGERRFDLGALAIRGQHGGLCEVAGPDATDRLPLRDIFFGLVELKGEAHKTRRRSLLLALELCKQFSAEAWVLDEGGFSSAVYFGELANEEQRLKLEVPPVLADIAERWRMFYFHHSMSVGLEGMFSWLVTNLATSGLAGASLSDLVGGLDAHPCVKHCPICSGATCPDRSGR